MGKGTKIGTLFVVSTPLGNLKDITLRAVDILRVVHVIAAEDTRGTRRLLSAYGIRGHLVSYREQNRERAAIKILDVLRDGRDAALVTDAGTPGISDPGGHLISLCISEEIEVIPIPGPSSIICALSVSGIDSSQFVFLGFLPRKGKKREAVLAELGNETRTAVIFESPKRVQKTLPEILNYAGDRMSALCRELTKVHEEIMRGRVSEILEKISHRTDIRGEVVIVIAGKDTKEGTKIDSDTLRREAQRLMSENPGKRPKEVARLLSARLGVSIKTAYDEVIRKRK